MRETGEIRMRNVKKTQRIHLKNREFLGEHGKKLWEHVKKFVGVGASCFM